MTRSWEEWAPTPIPGCPMTPTACPYCNALAGSELRDGRLVCKRCGEAWPGGPAPVATATGSALDRPLRTRTPALVVLAVLALAGAVLVVWRPWERSESGPGSDAIVGRIYRPADVPGLGWLPDQMDAVIAVQVVALAESLGPDAAADPEKALAALGLPDAVTRAIESMSVVGLGEVSDLVLGIRFNHIPPQMVLVLRTRTPFNPDELDRRTKSREQERDGRALHATKGGALGDVYWWAADDRTLVVTMLAKDFDDVPKQPRPRLDHLKPQLRDLMDTQVSKEACAWLVGHSETWDATVRAYAFLPLTALSARSDLIPPAGRLRSFAMSVPAPDEKIVLTTTLKSVEAATDLRMTWTNRFAGEPVEVGGEGEVIRLSMPKDASRVGSLFGRLIGPKP